MPDAAPPAPPFALLDEIHTRLGELDAEHLRRVRRVTESPCAPSVRVDGRNMLAFASNDYLGLAQHPTLRAALQRGVEEWGAGAGASHLVSGHSRAHDQLERALADFVGMPAALGFSTGYMANIAVMPALVGRGDAIFSDRLNHASLLDGAQLSRADLQRYPHCDLGALGAALTTSRARRKLIVSDSVFSMDGDLAPLAGLLALAREHNAWLLIDDAHGFGVLGPQGRGALAAAGLQDERLILMGTLGKAAGLAGAFVAGQAAVIEWLLQRARPYIFTTAAPPMLAAALRQALELIADGDALRAQLQTLIGELRARLKLRHWQLLHSDTAIQPVLVGDNATTVALSRRLWQEGLWVPAIRPPTVPAGTARLRISLSAAHSLDDVARLAAALNAAEESLQP